VGKRVFVHGLVSYVDFHKGFTLSDESEVCRTPRSKGCDMPSSGATGELAFLRWGSRSGSMKHEKKKKYNSEGGPVLQRI